MYGRSSIPRALAELMEQRRPLQLRRNGLAGRRLDQVQPAGLGQRVAVSVVDGHFEGHEGIEHDPARSQIGAQGPGHFFGRVRPRAGDRVDKTCSQGPTDDEETLDLLPSHE